MTELASWEEPRSVRMTTAYLKRLLIERHNIRASLENPGGSLILMGTAASVEAVNQYSSEVGNNFHLDLIEAEQVVNELPVEERAQLLAWCDGLTPQQAAQFLGVKPGTLRKRRERVTKRLVNKLNEGEGQDAGTAG